MMTGPHPYEKRARIVREGGQYDLLEGTSARSRPFSFDEIMRGRKNREDVANRAGNDNGVAKTTSSRDGTEKVSPSSDYRLVNDSSGRSYKNQISNDLHEERVRRIENSDVTGNNRKLVHDNRKESHQADTESRRTEDYSDRITKARDEKYHRNDWRKRDDSDYGVGKRQVRDYDKKENVSQRRRIRSEITRPEDNNDNRLVDRKRMNDKRINSDYENKRRNDKDEIKTDKLAGRGRIVSTITRADTYRDHRLVDRKRKNDEPINSDYKTRSEKDEIKTEKLSSRGGDESEATRPEDHRDHRLVDRKRKNDERINNDYMKRSEKDAIKTDKLTSIGGDKAEKENKNKSHAKDEGKTRGLSSGEKHGVLENKELEPTRRYFEGARHKRRHSHSRERTKERGRRSRSHSPKAHKHTNKERKEPVELSSHSMKEKTEREPSDAEKRRASHNESSSHYRKNTGPSSGLGGYSPRKRKPGAGLKTPSPTRRSPERRTAGWDLQPVKDTGIVGGPALANLQSTNQTFSWKLNETSNITPVTPLSIRPTGNTYQNLVSQMQAIESVQLTEATRPMRRLYVENVPTSVSDKDLLDCINRHLLASGSIHIQGTQPCLSCIIHREKAQALLEFLTPEDASAAVSLDSISISGSNIKLRRPKDYSTPTGVVEKSVCAVGLPSDIVEDSPNKIFIGRIPKLISSTMILEIARTFGAVKAYHFEFNTDVNESCAFLEYVDHSVSPKACAGLNGMRLGGQVITAVFSSPDAALENAGKVPCYGIPEHAKPLLEKPTAVLKLKNMLDPGSLLSLSELDVQEILEDVRLECSRFGMVKSVNVSKQNNSSVTSEAVEVNNTIASIDAHELNESYITEQSGRTLDESEEKDRTTDSPENKSNMGNDNPDINRSEVVDHSSFDETIASHNMKGEECQPYSDENISAQHPSGKEKSPNAPISELEPNISGATPPNEESKNKSVIGEDSKFLKNDGSKNQNTLEEGDKEDDISPYREDMFEPGSVFVEFKRAEAACMAAHSLHGRTFDGRFVAVEYVDHGIYTRRFQG